jgi:hypothetical protein
VRLGAGGLRCRTSVRCREQNEARAAVRRAQAERVAAYYEAQERAREERENAAIRARVCRGQDTS